MAKVRLYRPTFIKEWREYRDMTQAKLGEAIDRSESLISQLEAGKAPYTQYTLEAIASVLGCSTGDLLHRPPKGKEPLHEALSGLTEPQQEEALELIEIVKRRRS